MSEHFNGLAPDQAELLSLLAEECAEVIQVVAKIQRHGLHSHNPFDLERTTNLELLHQELGDVATAAQLLIDIELLEQAQLNDAAQAKLARVGKYLHHHRTKEFP